MLQQSHIPLTNGIMSFMEASEDHELAPIGIGSMHKQAKKLAEYGRHGDIYFVHAAEGETVVPMEVLNANPKVKDMLFNQMREMGLDPDEFVVGNELNSINPVTGMPEFFFSKVWRKVKKVAKKVVKFAKKAAPYVIPLVLSAFGVPFLGTMAPGMFGAGTFGAAFMGGGISSLVQGGSLKDALKAGAVAGVMNIGTSGLKSAFTGGDFMEGAMKSVYNPQAATFGTQLERFAGAIDPSGPEGSWSQFLGGQAPTSVDYWDAPVSAPIEPTKPNISGQTIPPRTMAGTEMPVGDPIKSGSLMADARAYQASSGFPEPYNLRQPFNVATVDAANIPVPGGARASVTTGAREAGIAQTAAEKAFEDAVDKAPWYKSIPSPGSTRIGPAEFVAALPPGVDVGPEVMKEAIKAVNPGYISDYGLMAAVPAAGYGIYEATQPSAEEEEAERERKAKEKLKKERAEWYLTTGEHLFEQSRRYPPGHALHDPDEYWKYVPRPPRRMMAGTSQGAASASLFGARGGLAEYPPRDLLVEGPGTERSDEIPAMLSDGEFVMNSKSVRGADPSGRGNRYAGANNLYNMMRNFEMRA